MSEKVTHTAVVDDCLNLTLATGELCPTFTGTLEDHWDFCNSQRHFERSADCGIMVA